MFIITNKMEASNTNVNMFQKALDEDKDTQSSFICNEIKDDSDSDDDTCKIVFPKQKRSKYSDTTSQELLHELIKQQQILSQTQKKMYKLQSTINSEEIVTRYIKLDLNNTQVILDETKIKLKKCKKELLDALFKEYSMALICFLYMLWQVYTTINSLL
jgi:ribosomal protein L17